MFNAKGAALDRATHQDSLTKQPALQGAIHFRHSFRFIISTALISTNGLSAVRQRYRWAYLGLGIKETLTE
jgi:hypothetical protein